MSTLQLATIIATVLASGILIGYNLEDILDCFRPTPRPKYKRVSYYEGIKMLREGKADKMTEYRGSHFYISLDSTGTPGWYVFNGYAHTGWDYSKTFRAVNEDDKSQMFYVLMGENNGKQ